jgi:hypothetical protein
MISLMKMMKPKKILTVIRMISLMKMMKSKKILTVIRMISLMKMMKSKNILTVIHVIDMMNMIKSKINDNIMPITKITPITVQTFYSGGLRKMWQLFGEKTEEIIGEMNEALAA